MRRTRKYIWILVLVVWLMSGRQSIAQQTLVLAPNQGFKGEGEITLAVTSTCMIPLQIKYKVSEWAIPLVRDFPLLSRNIKLILQKLYLEQSKPMMN
ncbi:hypothetical protein MATR_02640 [Marivirga tractuosa]|uniref:Uncharacterized protein n=1 Tax=Marivirga tractuosa (strain ATCC 23168 / DSM 4126 / NBRC 15989 / NCIMB 1408 / VKM B-1430 / H-43) TaxID=643867 RepID=E4TV06_MARTH|nr:hypothetical protein [Marivirga tractuosa]ADR22099.1 hypothetical protein Ftrac_2117 [Marivirga tractuosa DSM 4126]BDD13439.1 hypothetical protein MATR_02640 [Marivirga tractuosa]